MRISDWSSDVCSSDLRLPAGDQPPDGRDPSREGDGEDAGAQPFRARPDDAHSGRVTIRDRSASRRHEEEEEEEEADERMEAALGRSLSLRPDAEPRDRRSEEHTSELQ